MSTSGRHAGAENPFSTCRTRPGAIPYVFPRGESALGLVRRLRQNGWRGQIIGEHGSGKSALLATLIPAIRQSGRPTLLIELHDGQRRLPLDLSQAPELAARPVVIIDGYEQLSFWSRWCAKRLCRRHGLGLVVTAHAPVGLPALFCTTTSPELVETIVRQLLGESQSFATAEELQQQFLRHRGNLRELLFALYDRYEQQRGEGRGTRDER